jgi:hypothetical protein
VWLQKADAGRTWSGLGHKVNQESVSLFNVCVHLVGTTRRTVLFWEDPQIDGLAAASFSLEFGRLVKLAECMRKMVCGGLVSNICVWEVADQLFFSIMVQYLQLRSAFCRVQPIDASL